MKKKIERKIKSIQKQNEKLLEKMGDQELEGIRDSYFWYELQVKANENLIEFYRKELER